MILTRSSALASMSCGALLFLLIGRECRKCIVLRDGFGLRGSVVHFRSFIRFPFLHCTLFRIACSRGRLVRVTVRLRQRTSAYWLALGSSLIPSLSTAIS